MCFEFLALDLRHLVSFLFIKKTFFLTNSSLFLLFLDLKTVSLLHLGCSGIKYLQYTQAYTEQNKQLMITNYYHEHLLLQCCPQM